MITINYFKAITALIRQAEDDHLNCVPESMLRRSLSILITDLEKAAAWAGYYSLLPAVTPAPPAELKSEQVQEPGSTPGEGSAP